MENMGTVGAKLGLPENLDEKLAVISEMPITTDSKIWMSLVCLGEIPAWELDVDYKNGNHSKVDLLNARLIDAGFETEAGRECVFEEPFVAYGEEFDRRKCVYYARSKADAKKLSEVVEKSPEKWTSEDHVSRGKLYGFPQTAIDNYGVEAQMIGWRDLPATVQAEDYVFLAQFALSRAHWQSELKVVERWADVLKKHVPGLWEKYVDERRRLLGLGNGDLE